MDEPWLSLQGSSHAFLAGCKEPRLRAGQVELRSQSGCHNRLCQEANPEPPGRQAWLRGPRLLSYPENRWLWQVRVRQQPTEVLRVEKLEELGVLQRQPTVSGGTGRSEMASYHISRIHGWSDDF